LARPPGQGLTGYATYRGNNEGGAGGEAATENLSEPANPAGSRQDAGLTSSSNAPVDTYPEPIPISADPGAAPDAGKSFDRGAASDAGMSFDPGAALDAGTSFDPSAAPDTGISFNPGAVSGPGVNTDPAAARNDQANFDPGAALDGGELGTLAQQMMKPVVPLEHARRTDWLMKQRNKRRSPRKPPMTRSQQRRQETRRNQKLLPRRRLSSDGTLSRFSPSRKRWMR
jgi:hypothetical protein